MFFLLGMSGRTCLCWVRMTVANSNNMLQTLTATATTTAKITTEQQQHSSHAQLNKPQQTAATTTTSATTVTQLFFLLHACFAGGAVFASLVPVPVHYTNTPGYYYQFKGASHPSPLSLWSHSSLSFPFHFLSVLPSSSCPLFLPALSHAWSLSLVLLCRFSIL